jgi:hypothetical protein
MRQPAEVNPHAKVGRSMPANGLAMESESFTGLPLAQGVPMTQTHSTDLSSYLAARFVAASQYEGYVPELSRLPECMRQDVAETAEYLVPAGHGLTTAVAFFANKHPEAADSAGVRREGLVILLHGLGQDCCESNWIWIHSFLKSGFSVLAVSMDGHSRTPLSSFDPRLATRTIPLIISKLEGLQSSFKIFAVGQGLGATYCLLAASRSDCAKALSAVACISPRLTAEGASEMSGSPIPIGRPVQLCKDGVRLGRYYGTGGFRRLWRGDSGKLLRKRLLLSTAVETQVEMFLSENVSSQDVWTSVKVSVAVVASDRSPTSLALERVHGVNSMLVTRFDKDRTVRGLQFTEEWPRRVTRFFESYCDDGAKGLREEF